MTKREEWAAAKSAYGMFDWYADQSVQSVLAIDEPIGASGADAAAQVHLRLSEYLTTHTEEDFYAAVLVAFYSLTGMTPLQ